MSLLTYGPWITWVAVSAPDDCSRRYVSEGSNGTVYTAPVQPPATDDEIRRLRERWACTAAVRCMVRPEPPGSIAA